MVNKDWQPSPDYKVGDILTSCWENSSYHVTLIVLQVNKNATRGSCAYQTLIINVEPAQGCTLPWPEAALSRRKSLTKHTAHHEYKRLNERV